MKSKASLRSTAKCAVVLTGRKQSEGTPMACASGHKEMAAPMLVSTCTAVEPATGFGSVNCGISDIFACRIQLLLICNEWQRLLILPVDLGALPQCELTIGKEVRPLILFTASAITASQRDSNVAVLTGWLAVYMIKKQVSGPGLHKQRCSRAGHVPQKAHIVTCSPKRPNCHSW